MLSDQQKRLELNSALDFEERRMFYRNDLYTPPGGSYSFQKPRPAPANPRPSAYARPSARCDDHMHFSLRSTTVAKCLLFAVGLEQEGSMSKLWYLCSFVLCKHASVL